MEEECVCISGGVALNALANGLIHSQTPFKYSHVFGPAGDSGGALGSALYTYYSLNNGVGGVIRPGWIQTQITSLSLGSHYSNSEIEPILKKYNLTYKKTLRKRINILCSEGLK